MVYECKPVVATDILSVRPLNNLPRTIHTIKFFISHKHITSQRQFIHNDQAIDIAITNLLWTKFFFSSFFGT